MSKHSKTKLEKARDELFSHIQRCDVLEAQKDHRLEWLSETVDFMAERFPGLSEIELAQLEVMGKRYLRPPIPHGAKTNALNRDRWQDKARDEARAAA